MPEYFSHDYGARNDPKMVNLLRVMGHDGHGIYWGFVEYLYEQGGYLLLSELECYAFELHTQCDKLRDIVLNFGLFENNGEKIWSESALKRLNERKLKSEKASKSASYRWGNAEAMRTYSDSNAKKESKVNNKKEIIVPEHLKSTINAFIEHRKKLRRPLTDYATGLIISKVQKMYPSDNLKQVAAINQAIEKGWQGVFELKDEPNTTSTGKPKFVC